MEAPASPDASPARRALTPARDLPKEPRRAAKLQDRIVVFFVVLLMAVQLASFYLIRYAIEQTAQNTLRQELRVGSRVFRRLLDQNTQQLVEATSVLTYDFGFREAIATRDRATILSALTNHAARIKASGMAVIGLDGRVVSDTLRPESAGHSYPHPDLINDAAARGRTSAVRLADGKPYQVVVVPVLAPLPIAWTSMSFVIDDSVARDLQSLTLSEVSFLEVSPSGARLLATTTPPSRRESLLAVAPRVIAAGDEGLTVSLANEDFMALAAKLDGTGPAPLVAILQRSVADGLQPYFVLQVLLLFLAGASLTVTLVGAIRLARHITRPVAALAAAAREIERGNYDVRVDATGSFELMELARAFDGMIRGLVERDNMRDVLGKVASTAVVDQFLTGQIELGGEERDVTVMFTDVRNFTALAERMTPTQSLALLNEFLTEISRIVEEHGGVIDKYMGDGVMALFGAPVSRPDDARRALQATLAIREGVRAMGPRLAQRGMPHAEVGVGLNTSRVIAGNIGSPTRLNYTVLGDGVNLASRLEGLTKRYHVPIIVGERTREAGAGIVFRELDKVRVRGKTVPVRIFEPMAREGELPVLALRRLEDWHAALGEFRGRRWSRARAAFEAFADERDYARLAQIYFRYMDDLEVRSPGPDWDGAFTLYEK